MGKIRSLTISLTNLTNELVYFGGQVVQGKVHVDVKEEVKIEAVNVQLVGYAHVQWSESRGSGNSRHTVTFRSHENYIDVIIPLQTPPTGSSEVALAAGMHEYPFQIQLPAGCPQSYESRVGRVRYCLEAHVKIPWAFDERYNLTFTVLRHYDLNALPHLLNGVAVEDSKTLCCLCCASGPIHAKMTLDRIGYVPGEAIAIKAEANNGSNRTMSSSFATILMQVSYHTSRKTKVETTEVARISKGEIGKGDSEVWYGEQLVIPPVPASDLPGCNIITIKYMVVFNVDPAGPAFDLTVPADITIGTIPLRQTLQQYGFQAPPPPQQPPTAPMLDYSDPNVVPPPNIAMPGMPPPSYSASVFGAVNTNNDDLTEEQANQRVASNAVQPQNTSDGQEFVPMYTYYNWNK